MFLVTFAFNLPFWRRYNFVRQKYTTQHNILSNPKNKANSISAFWISFQNPGRGPHARVARCSLLHARVSRFQNMCVCVICWPLLDIIKIWRIMGLFFDGKIVESKTCELLQFCFNIPQTVYWKLSYDRKRVLSNSKVE